MLWAGEWRRKVPRSLPVQTSLWFCGWLASSIPQMSRLAEMYVTLCSWAATNNSCFYHSGVYNSSTLTIFEALDSYPLSLLSLKYMFLFTVDMAAHLTASVFPLDDLCLVNRNSVRLIRVGQSTHNLQAVVTQEDSSSLLSTLCWGKVNCLMGGSACSWPPFWFLDLFYLPQPRVGLWWSVTGEDIPEADPDCAWVPDSSKSHLSCSIFSISELLLGKTVQQPMDCLCNGSLLLTAVFSVNYLVLDSGLLMDTLACMLAYCSKSDLSGGGRACSLSVVALCALCKQSKCGLWAEEVPSGTTLCARGTGWFHKDFESSQEGCRKSQSSFSSCHDFFFF